jgi:hypothetical protein
MGTTLWCLSKSKMADGDDFDHSAMFEATKKLDLICIKIGVKEISSFYDWTDYNANMANEEPFPDSTTLKNRAVWFSPKDALPMLVGLKEYFENNQPKLEELFDAELQHFSEYLMDELNDCITKLKIIDGEKDLFHFCVVA